MAGSLRPREAALRTHYAAKPDYYTPAVEPHLSAMLQLVQAPTSGTHLDVGCGNGRSSAWARRNHMQYLGVDYCEERIAAAKRTFGHGNPRPRFVVGDVYEYLPMLPRGGYSLVTAFEHLEHLEHPEQIVTAMQRVCAPGGLVVATVPVNMPYKAHLQVYLDEADVQRQLRPASVRRVRTEKREHFLLTWSPGGLDETPDE